MVLCLVTLPNTIIPTRSEGLLNSLGTQTTSKHKVELIGTVRQRMDKILRRLKKFLFYLKQRLLVLIKIFHGNTTQRIVHGPLDLKFTGKTGIITSATEG